VSNGDQLIEELLKIHRAVFDGLLDALIEVISDCAISKLSDIEELLFF
jgi:hypothetical protein